MNESSLCEEPSVQVPSLTGVAYSPCLNQFCQTFKIKNYLTQWTPNFINNIPLLVKVLEHSQLTYVYLSAHYTSPTVLIHSFFCLKSNLLSIFSGSRDTRENKLD